MTKPRDPLAPRARQWLAAALLALTALTLAACGPGTGGTGTGPVTATLSFSAITGAVTTSGGGVGTAAPCTTACERTELQLEPGRVTLSTPCQRFVFTGEWVVNDTGPTELAGLLDTTTAGGTQTAPATLRLVFSDRVAASALVTATLTGSAGTTLLGPTSLLRNEVASTAALPPCVLN